MPEPLLNRDFDSFIFRGAEGICAVVNPRRLAIDILVSKLGTTCARLKASNVI